jgi:hypothetical protein
MTEAAAYTLVVRARGSPKNPRPWGEEIFRDGEPFPGAPSRRGLLDRADGEGGRQLCLGLLLEVASGGREEALMAAGRATSYLSRNWPVARSHRT